VGERRKSGRVRGPAGKRRRRVSEESVGIEGFWVGRREKCERERLGRWDGSRGV